MADLKAFAEQLVNLTVKEVSELATILKEYGIEPQPQLLLLLVLLLVACCCRCRRKLLTLY